MQSQIEKPWDVWLETPAPPPVTLPGPAGPPADPLAGRRQEEVRGAPRVTHQRMFPALGSDTHCYQGQAESRKTREMTLRDQ